MGDQVPPAIEQLGAKVTYIDEDELAWGDLSKHDVIVTGVRAYERRADLRAYNRRLLDYVSRGGTRHRAVQQDGVQPGGLRSVSRQGQRQPRVATNWFRSKYWCPPIRYSISRTRSARRRGPDWVQERGLYFLGEKDPKYVDLVSMTDSFKDNPGEKLGSLVEAKYGKGRWIYLGLGLWRQLPAGTDGAYQLLANLIGLSKVKAADTGR